MNQIKLILSITILFSSLFSVSVCASKSNNVVRKMGDMAEEAFYFANYREAIELYYKLDSLDPEGHSYYMYQIGLSYLYSNLDNEQAIPNIEESVAELSQGELADVLYYHLGRAYQINYEFDRAIEYFNKVLELVEHYDMKGLQKEVTRQIEICNNAKEIVKNPLDVKIKDVGSGINTSWPDYKPIITADEAFIYYTSRRPNSTGEKTDRTGRYFEDIYVSQRDVFGYWGYPNHISKVINTEFDEATIGISADGHTMYLYKGHVKGGEIFVSKLVGTEWSEPKITEHVNSKYWETSATITGDGKTMYFVSNRKGGKGDRDIYQALLQEDGTWGKITNIGATINTPYDEDTPFIHPNGKTLYFCSTGHNTMGGFDIFKSDLVNGEWTEPVNMGYPINTTCDDFHFVTNAQGSRGYYSSAQTGGLGEQDIYTVDFNDVSVPILLVRGNIKTEGIELSQAKPQITIIDKANGNVIHTVYQPNVASGKYLITLPPAHEYDMIVEAEGFKPYQTTIKMPQVDEFHEVYQVITLRSLADGKGQEILVQNIFEDTRINIDGDTSLVAIANKNNRDYLETIAHTINDGIDNEAAVAQALNMTDHVAEKLLDNDKPFTEATSSLYVYEEGNPDKGLTEYVIDGHIVMVLNNDYEETPELIAEITAYSTDEKNLADDGNSSSGLDGGNDDNIVDNNNSSSDLDNNVVDSNNSSSGSDGGNNNTGNETDHSASLTFEVKFGFDQYSLDESYLNDIEVIYTMYKQNKEAYIEISGHTDSKGPKEYNKALSQRRADTVANYLIKKGVPKDQIRTIAFGEDQPVAPNTNPDGTDNSKGRSQNRRTEIKIINH
ncbi:MAG: OmpA family protein [Flavobacteriales bacterium]|nr:OmpA family protein [Flavobacteriales bacterium]